MPPAVGIVAALAGSALAGPLGVGLLNLGIGLSAGAGILAGQIGGFVVSTAISQVGSRLFSKQPKAPDFSGEASGRTVTIRSSVESHKVIYGQAKVSGPLAFVKTVDFGTNNLGVQNGAPGGNGFLHMVIPLAGHEVEEIGTLYLNDRPCTLDAAGFVNEEPYNYNDGNGLKFVRVKKHLGTAGQEADPDLIAECGLTPDHRLRGIAYAYIRFHWNPNVFPLGIPNVSFVVKGKKVYDPRTTLTVWSDNAALCVRDYLASSYGFGCDADEINDAYFTASANVCDEDVALTAGGTQNRYTCNGVIDTAVAPLDNLGSLVSSVAGAVTYVQGQFRLHAGSYDSPAGDITADMLAGPVRAELRTPRKELFNAVKGTYVDPNKQWQPTDFPFVTNATYEDQDGGERIYKDVDLPFTNHPEAAQRIGKILLEKARQGIKLELTLNHSALKYAVYDTVTFTDDQFGWSAKVFRVLKVSTTGTGPITLFLQEESSASYDWNSGEATTVDAAPDTNLPDPFTVRPPGSPSVVESLYVTTDGSGVKAKATVSWDASNDAFAKEYQAEYKLTTATAYTSLPRITGTTIEILDVAPGTYNVRVKAINILGVSSTYSATIAELYGLTARPADMTGFGLNAIGGAAHLSWDRSADLDVVNGGYVRIRYTPLTSGATWSAAVDIGTALPGTTNQAVLPLLDGTYLAKFIDSSGNTSDNAATIIATLSSLLELNVVASLTEHPDFGGTKTTIAYDSELGGIKIAGATNWDAYPGNVDTWPKIDALGGTAAGGTYGFSNGIDLGAVYTSRVTAAIKASGYDVGNTIDARLSNIDTWTSFDGQGNSQFTTSNWTPSGTTITADQAIGPDGTLTADSLTETVDPGSHAVFINGNTFNMGRTGVAVTEVLHVRPNGRDFKIEHARASGTVSVTFDLANGEIETISTGGSSTLTDYGISAVGNGFYRCWVTSQGAVGFDISFLRHYLLDAGFSQSYTGDGTSGVYVANYDLYPGPLRTAAEIDDVNATLYLRSTDDDPAGSPVWSDWRPFFVGDYTARGFEFELELTSASDAHNMLVTELAVTVDMPGRMESEKNVVSGAGTYSATFPSAFKATPSINITPKNLATGDYYAVSNESSTGFDVVFRNAAGSAVSRTFDYHAKGYGKQVT